MERLVIKKKQKWYHDIVSYLEPQKEKFGISRISYCNTESNDEEWPCLVITLNENYKGDKIVALIKGNVSGTKDNFFCESDGCTITIWPWPPQIRP